jgi:hypothetical protein
MTKLTESYISASYKEKTRISSRSDVSKKRDKTPTAYQNGRLHFKKMYSAGVLPGCSKGFLSGFCGNGHEFLKNILCSKEYCADCGKDGSPIHSNRINRWTPKARALNEKTLGVLVVTIPEELRNEFTYPGYMSNFRTALKNQLKKMGYGRGLMRWHLFGDCAECKGKGCLSCFNTGAGRIYKPHLNIVINEGFIRDIFKSSFYAEITTFCKTYFEHRHGFYTDKKNNIHYSFKNTPQKIGHIIKYITRATHKIFNAEIAEQLHNYRLTTSWGTWRDAKEETEKEKLTAGICLCCEIEKTHTNNKIKWRSLNENSKSRGRALRYVDNGIFNIASGNTQGFDNPTTRIQNENRRSIEGNIRPRSIDGFKNTRVEST